MRIQRPEHLQGKKIVIVVGGGFAGLNAAKTLANEPGIFVLLVDQRNHHLFQPLLYQVATAGLNPGDIAVPIRSQFSDAVNVEVHWEKVMGLDLEKNLLRSQNLEIKYDYLILACGAQHSYFNHPEWEEFAPGLKTLEQATEIRRRILSAFESAENEQDSMVQRALLSFVVVGGGATGVELAGAIADISRTVLVNDFKRIDPSKARVILLEAAPRLLAAFDSSLSEHTVHDLTHLGVEVRTLSKVENINAAGVTITGATGIEEFIPARSVFWAAGVAATQLSTSPEVEKDRAGRIKVMPDLSLPGFSNVFAIGDMAAVEWKTKSSKPGAIVPGLAPAAIQEGRHAAQMILASMRGEVRKPFRYLDKGQMATIGKNRAILQAGSLKITGYFAWLAWLFVHIFYLIGFKNRVAVMAQWVWNYVFSKRGARLITGRRWKLRET